MGERPIGRNLERPAEARLPIGYLDHRLIRRERDRRGPRKFLALMRHTDLAAGVHQANGPMRGIGKVDHALRRQGDAIGLYILRDHLLVALRSKRKNALAVGKASVQAPIGAHRQGLHPN